jgi:uncharacterized protein involved in response to NO
VTAEAPGPARSPSPLPDPYRLLFPIGLTWGVIGAGLWPLHAFGAIPWPTVAHRSLMIQGFEHSFVLGFLLTAIPGFTKGERCRPAELRIAVLSALTFGVATLAGQALVAQGVFVLSLMMLLVAVARRLRRPKVAPPLELMFVGFGLLLGLAGGTVLLAGALGAQLGVPRFGERLVSLGMVLSLVLGVGGLLVPTFTGMRNPLVIPGSDSATSLSTLIAIMAFVAEGGRPGARRADRQIGSMEGWRLGPWESQVVLWGSGC